MGSTLFNLRTFLQLFEAMLRELKEETGLCLSMAECEKGTMSQLALWEVSSFYS
jgi:8-oxo-dGTP pyrophosphatase MutT (NUDIX family)